MSRAWPRARPLVAPLAVLLAHALMLRLLAALDVVGAILGAPTPPLGLLALTAVFYLLRVTAVFLAPGWLLVALVRVVRAR